MKLHKNKEMNPKPRGRLRNLSCLQTLLFLSLAVASLKYRVADARSTLNQEEDSIAIADDNSALETIGKHPLLGNQRTSDTEIPRKKNIEENDVIVVMAVDGTLAGISKDDGKLLWKHSKDSENINDEFDLETVNQNNNSEKSSINIAGRLLRPLVSTTTTTKSASSTEYTAVPSVDGKVFMTSSDVTVSSSVKEMVSRSPFMDKRGRFYVGSRQATAAALDGSTGEFLTVLSSAEQEKEQQHTPDGYFEGRNPVWIGRVDYSVAVQDSRTGMTDVQFSVAEVISVGNMQVGTKTDDWTSTEAYRSYDNEESLMEETAEQMNERPLMVKHKVYEKFLPERLDRFRSLPGPDGSLIASSQSRPNRASTIVATPSGNVAFRNPESGAIEWVADVTFDTPIAFAIEASSGVPLGVNIIPDAPEHGSSVAYISREMERQLDILDSQVSEDQTNIVGAMRSGQLYSLPLGGRQAASNHQKHASNLPHITGRQPLHLDGNPHHHQSGENTATSTKKNPKEVFSTQSGQASGSEESPQGGDQKTSGEGNIVMENNNLQEDGVFYHPEYGYISPNAYRPLQRRSKYTRVLRILGSWLPPTIALIFVLSFELGRRKRLKDNQKVNPTHMVDGMGEVVWSDNKPSQPSQQHVIQVSDEILGYGGHGTVVFKGMLEGRDVAVKRMLKAYHASADREISLLIESDGHPNVVRYFLKEVRGDFVYLALELCDLSLHDLISMLRQQQELASKKENKIGLHISSSIRLTLNQIASGVKHLHSLRIVHRDLKPANILLGVSKKNKKLSKEGDSTLDTFGKGLYVAKISDMGLGKQLVGQSSLGISLIANSSFQGAKDNSNPVGVGPGSVGWQAPEVMAMRLPSDASAPSDGSNLEGTSGVAEPSSTEPSPNTPTSRSADIFSLGCIFYSTLVPGSHPFGEWYEREANIMHNRPCIEPLEDSSPDAHDLVKCMLNVNPRFRPTAIQICEHPFFWSSQKKLTYLCDFSDRLETDAISQASLQVINILAIERGAVDVVGTSWDQHLDSALINNVQKFRSYDPSSVRDLLRLIRNKHHHFDELPDDFRASKMSNQEQMFDYFEAKFPRLLMHCFNFCRQMLDIDDPIAIKYCIPPSPQTSSKISSSTPQTVTVDKPNHVTEAALEEQSDDTPNSSEVPNVVASVIEKFNGTLFEDSDRAEVPTLKDETRKEVENENLHNQQTTAMMSDTDDIVVWEGSTAAKTLNCRGWSRSEEEWSSRIDPWFKKRDPNLKRAIDDPKFRTRLCNHWDTSLGTSCPMRKKNKCVFAHGPVELRVKEGKRNRWGKLLDKNGNNSNPCHSGGEDTYGAARSIETVRKVEGKWKTGKVKGNARGKRQGAASKEK